MIEKSDILNQLKMKIFGDFDIESSISKGEEDEILSILQKVLTLSINSLLIVKDEKKRKYFKTKKKLKKIKVKRIKRIGSQHNSLIHEVGLGALPEELNLTSSNFSAFDDEINAIDLGSPPMKFKLNYENFGKFQVDRRRSNQDIGFDETEGSDVE